jgi:hypothetical protein
LATASKAVRECFAAPIALAKAVKTGYAIAVDEANGPITKCGSVIAMTPCRGLSPSR